MTARLLPVEEWPRLAQTPFAGMAAVFDPSSVDVLVVERDGCIVASIALLSVLHAEGCWVSGGIGVRRALWRALTAHVARIGARGVWGLATDAPMRRVLARCGSAIVGDHFIVRM